MLSLIFSESSSARLHAWIHWVAAVWLVDELFVLTSNSAGYLIKWLVSVHVDNSKRAFESWLLSHEVRSQEAIKKKDKQMQSAAGGNDEIMNGGGGGVVLEVRGEI